MATNTLRPAVSLVSRKNTVLRTHRTIVINAPCRFHLHLLTFNSILSNRRTTTTNRKPRRRQDTRNSDAHRRRRIETAPILTHNSYILRISNTKIFKINNSRGQPSQLHSLNIIVRARSRFHRQIRVRSLSIILRRSRSHNNNIRSDLRAITLSDHFQLQNLLRPIMRILRLLKHRTRDPVIRVTLFIDIIMKR